MQLREPFGDETAVTDGFEAPPGEGRPGPAAATGPASSDAASSEDAAPVLRLHRWFDRAIVAVALIALFSGFGQFSVVAALGDVSKQLGHVAPGASIADKVGLSGTSLGIGLAIIRLASLGSLPLIGIADRFGRRRMILVVTVTGLAFTAVAALSPDYWWFVVVFAFGRPLLSATNTLAGVMAAEETGATDRAAAVALIAAGYGVGAGISAIVHSLCLRSPGFPRRLRTRRRAAGGGRRHAGLARGAEPLHDCRRQRPSIRRPCLARSRRRTVAVSSCWPSSRSPSRSSPGRPTASCSSTPRTSCTSPVVGRP